MSAVLELKDPGKVVLRGQKFWWNKLRAMGKDATFTVSDLDLAGNDRIDNVRDFVRRLEAAGIVACEQRSTLNDRDHRYQKSVYKILRTPRTLPPLTRDGSEGLQGRRQQNMWNYMRMAPRFTKRDLAKFASVDGLPISDETAASFIKHLRAAGYLKVLQTGISRKVPGIYRLDPAKNTGPNAPLILKAKLVYDQNQEEIMGPVTAEATP